MNEFRSESPPSSLETASLLSQVPLVPTGVPHLDTLLGGGTTQGSLAIILGPPGSGKTTLAGQIAFAHARSGRKVLVLAALAESPTSLLEHLCSFRFFDPDLVGDAIQFFSMQQFVGQQTPLISGDLLALARQTQAQLLVIDGSQSFREAGSDGYASRQLLYALATSQSLYGVTTLVTTEAEPRDPALFPEMTTCDVLIGLYFRQQGVRTLRSLEILKSRGRPSLLGHHSMSIREEGIQIFPRLESQFKQETPDVWRADVPIQPFPERVPFGLASLDEALGGGLTRRTSTLLTGSLGTGKTLLALQFVLAGIDQGEPAVFLNFRESNEQLIQKATPFAFARKLRTALTSGKLVLQRWEPIELNPDRIAAHLLEAIKQIKAHRVVIDNITEFERAVKESGEPERIPNYLSALLASLRAHNATTLVIKEISKGIATNLDFLVDDLSTMAENVLVIQQLVARQQLYRVLSVLKMRFSLHDYTLRILQVKSPEGIHVLTPEESQQMGLGGIIEQQGEVWANDSSSQKQ